MESKKAEEYIMKHRQCMLDNETMGVTCYAVKEAVEIAEQEAAEKHQKEMAELKEKAVKAHRQGCGYYDNNTMECMEPPYFGTHECDDGCVFMEKFKELIKNK